MPLLTLPTLSPPAAGAAAALPLAAAATPPSTPQAGAPTAQAATQAANQPAADAAALPRFSDLLRALGLADQAATTGTSDGQGAAAAGDDIDAADRLPAPATPEATFALVPPTAPVPLPDPAAAASSAPAANANPTVPAEAAASDATAAAIAAAATAVATAATTATAATAIAATVPAAASAITTAPSARAPGHAARSFAGVSATPSAPAASLPQAAAAAGATAAAELPSAAALWQARNGVAAPQAAPDTAAPAAAPADSAAAGLAPSATGTVPATTPGSDPIVLSPPIRLPAAAPVPEQRQALAAALGERLQVQIAQRSEHAVIRIEPPSMGSIEIAVRHEGGNLQVHMNASHGEVQRQLQQIGDSLKQELAQRHGGEVSVQVGGDARDADGRQRQRHAAPDEDRAAPGRALADAQTGGDTAASRFTLSSEPS